VEAAKGKNYKRYYEETVKPRDYIRLTQMTPRNTSG